MSTSSISFIVWSAFMVGMLVSLVIASRRGRSRSQETEDVASKALPEIGGVAERAFNQRFGRAPTDLPAVSRTRSGTWYPPAKRTAKTS